MKTVILPTLMVSLLSLQGCGGGFGTCSSSRNVLTMRTDWGDDGHFDQVDEYSYDGDLLLTQQTRSIDGVPNYANTRAFSYDDADQLIRMTNDYDSDGTVEWLQRYTYDDDGHMLSQSFDADADGEADQRWTYSYDAHGNLVRDCVEGSSCVVYTYTYDGDRVSRMCESNGPCTDYTYDRKGVLRQSVRGIDDAGSFTETITSSFDACGRPSSVEDVFTQDPDNDGQPEYTFTQVISYELDEEGSVVRQEIWSGTPNDQEEHTLEVTTFAYTYD